MASNGLPISQLTALMDAVREEFENKGGFIDWQTYYDLPILQRAIGGKLRMEGSHTISFNRRGTSAGNFKWTQAWATDDVGTDREILKWSATMCFGDTAVQWDTRERDMNQGPEELVDLYEMDLAGEMEFTARSIEEALALVRQNTSATKQPMGLFEHACMGPAGAYDPGFVGTRARYLDWPGGSSTTGTTTTIGGLDRSTSDLLANYAAPYSGKINKATISIIKMALLKTGFRAHPLGKQGSMASLSPTVLLMDSDRAIQLSDYMDEAGQKSDQMQIKGVQCESVPVWDPQDSDGAHHAVRSYAPIVGVRYRTKNRVQGVGFHVLRNRWMKASEAMKIEGNHNGAQIFYDVACQQTCPDPRTSVFVLHTQIAA